MSDSLQPHGLQHARLLCPSPSPRVCSNSCPSSQWCHPTISSSVSPFSSCPQSFSASGAFPMSRLFTPGGQRIGASASVLPMNIQGWLPLVLTGLISLQSNRLSRVFSSTTIRHLLLGRKAVRNLDSVLNSRHITLPTKVCIVKAMVFPVYLIQIWELDHKEGKCRRTDAFELCAREDS